MKYLSLFALILSAVLTGCASSPDALRTMDPYALCHEYAKGRSPQAYQAVLDRGLVRGEFAYSVVKAQPKIGMTETEAICALGKPEKINHSANKSGERTQWVYSSPRQYLYFENGELTGWN